MEVVAEVREPPPEDRTASVEVIRVDDRPAGATLAEVLDEVPGVRVQRLGGLESFATISIRGSEASQVLILRDGVPLGSAAGAEVNLNEIPLDDVERIEIYRGPSAAHFGAGGLGGVINLVTRDPGSGSQSRLDLGLGSFMPGSWDPGRVFSFSARRSLGLRTVARGGVRRRWSVLAQGSFWNTAGDFTYFDDNGTRWDRNDDAFALRQNNDATQGDLVLRSVVELTPSWNLTIAETASVRSQGIAGYGQEVSSHARLRTFQDLFMLELERPRPQPGRPRLTLRAFLRYRGDEWSDPEGDIGLTQDHDLNATLDTGARLRAGWVLPAVLATAWLQGELRYERFSSRNLLGDEEPWGWHRTSGALAGWVSWRLAGGAVELAPQARIDVVHDAPGHNGPPVAGGAQPEASTSVFTSEQLGLRGLPTRWLTIRASGGLTQRPPTFMELFGDRGTIVGNPQLRPESGWTVDAGVLLHWRDLGAVEHLRLEATGFYRQVDDLIQLVPNSQVTFVSDNVGAARIAGLEASGLVRVDWASGTRSPWRGWITLRVGLTYMDAVNLSDRAAHHGKQLPLRPDWQVFGRLALTWGPLTLAYELDYVAGNYLDLYNSYPVPHRLLHSAELTADLSRWRGPELTLLVRNLSNNITEEIPVRGHGDLLAPVSDVAGFPLPGLTVFLTLRWDLDVLRRGRNRSDRETEGESEDETPMDLASGPGPGRSRRGRL